MRNESFATTRVTVACTLLLALAAGGCDSRRESGSDTVPGLQPTRRREVVATAWDTLWSVGGAASDTLLLRPYLLAASGTGVYLYDGGSSQVLSFTPDGKLRWTFGRKGSGPNEFRGVRDVKVSESGESYLLDPRNARIVRLDTAGRVRTRIPLTTVGHAEQLAVLDGERIVLLTMDPARAFAIVDTAGKVRERFSLPWERFAKLDQIARQGLIVSGRGREWIFGFSMGDGWFRFDGAAPVRAAGYVEHTEFPKIENLAGGGTKMAEYNACSACSASASGSTLYVHFGGYSRYRESVIDLYDLDDLRYQGSYVLPFKAVAISTVDDRVYALRDDPYPMLVALRPQLKASTPADRRRTERVRPASAQASASRDSR